MAVVAQCKQARVAISRRIDHVRVRHVLPWLVEGAYAASAAFAGPEDDVGECSMFWWRGGQVGGRATATANGSWMRRSDELIHEPSSAAWLNADCPKRSSVLALEGVEELHRTSQALLDGRARLCTRRNRLLLRARSVRSTAPQSTRHQKIFRKRALALGLIVATPYDLRLPFFRGAFTEIGATVWAGAVSAAVIEFGAMRCFYRALMDGAPREAIDMACRHGGISGAIKNLRGCLTRGLRTTIIVSSLRRGARVAKGGRL